VRDRFVLALFRMWRAEVRKLLEGVSVRLKAVGRDFTLGEESEAVIDDIVGEDAAIVYFAGLEGLKLSMSGSRPSTSIAAIASSRV